MATRLHPKAPVIAIRILEREPQRDHALRRRREKRRILMPVHFATDVRLLEDVHRLINTRLADSERANELVQSRIARKAIEDGIEIVHRVSDLVNRERFRSAQHAMLVERFFFEEATDRLRGFLEIRIARNSIARRVVNTEAPAGSKASTISSAPTP